MMANHSLRTWPEQWQAIVDGRKTFDMRRGNFEVDDILELREYDPEIENYTLAHRFIECRVTYVMRGPIFDLPGGCVVMSIEPAFGDSYPQFAPWAGVKRIMDQRCGS